MDERCRYLCSKTRQNRAGERSRLLQEGQSNQYPRYRSLLAVLTKSLTLAAANQTDHARIRKLLAHAFSDSALLEQEPLLILYFDLLVSKLKRQIDGPAHGRVDIMAYYNFTTFDIIGYTVFLRPNSTT